MRLRLVVIFCVLIAAAALGWVFSRASRDDGPAKVSVWAENIDDLEQCCRIKSAKASLYDAYAATARREKKANAMCLFQALAASERIHEANCAEALRLLGGQYTPSLRRTADTTGTTARQVARAIVVERKLHDREAGEMIRRAMEKHNRYAARILTWTAASDLKHLILLEHYQSNAGHFPPDRGYAVCPHCGNTFDTAYCDPYCPFCMTADEEFVRYL